jgi:hypothetical protein
MNINATILVQAINLGIAYILFRFLLLKPAVREIRHEQSMLAQLHQVIAGGMQAIEEKNQEQRRLWQERYDYYQLNKPNFTDIDRRFFRNISPSIQCDWKSQDQIESECRQVTNFLKNRLEKL